MFYNLETRVGLNATGIPWLPSAPADWPVTRLKRLLREEKDLVGEAWSETDLLALTKRGVVARDINNLEGKVPASFAGYQVLEPSDLVFCLFDVDETPRTVGMATSRGMITSAYTRFVVLDGALPRYLELLFASLDGRKLLRPLYTGLRKSIRSADLLATSVPLPSVSEQEAIIRYVANAHVRINQAIASKRRLLALLEEEREAVVEELLTQGITSSELRESRVEHVGSIPSHWDLVRAKYLFREFDVRSGTGTEPLLSLRLNAGLVRHADVSSVAIGPESLENYKVVQPGTVVMNRMRAASGVFAVAAEVGLVSPDYATMVVKGDVNAQYFLQLFKTRRTKAEFRRRSTGLGTGEAGFMRLQYGSFGQIPLPVPPRPEQDAIIREIEAKTLVNGRVTQRAEQEIRLLEEFRARLTSDVVTGQVDVREIAVALPPREPEAAFTAVDEPADADEDLDHVAADGMEDV